MTHENSSETAPASSHEAVSPADVPPDRLSVNPRSPLFDEATGRLISKEEYLAARNFNIYCDALGTMYAGGTPLFDPVTGRTQTLTAYLARKFVILR